MSIRTVDALARLVKTPGNRNPVIRIGSEDPRHERPPEWLETWFRTHRPDRLHRPGGDELKLSAADVGRVLCVHGGKHRGRSSETP